MLFDKVRVKFSWLVHISLYCHFAVSRVQHRHLTNRAWRQRRVRKSRQIGGRKGKGKKALNQHEGFTSRYEPTDSINSAEQRRFAKWNPQSKTYSTGRAKVRAASGSSLPANWIFSGICWVAVNWNIQNLEWLGHFKVWHFVLFLFFFFLFRVLAYLVHLQKVCVCVCLGYSIGMFLCLSCTFLSGGDIYLNL